MHLQSRISGFLLAALAAALLSTPVAAAEPTPARYDSMLAQYASLPSGQRAAWLSWLFTSRLEPACRTTMTRDAYDRIQAQQLAVLDRGRAGQNLSAGQLQETLELIDRQEAAAIQQLTRTFSRVTHEAVGTNLWLYQQRMQQLKAIRESCNQSAHPFENQPKLIAWLDAAIMQERLTDRPPLPATPDFERVDDRAWMAAGDRTPEVKTALFQQAAPATAGELEAKINDYNDELNEVVASLYASKRYKVAELNVIVDRMAQLGLRRVSLATSALRLTDAQRDQLTPIETLDDAIALARVKVSATRREILRVADHDTDRAQWDTLKGLNFVSRRLDTLYTGPDR
ncbi:MAG: hypothetical protein WD845_04335 [Pirellulales bacterium]